VTATARPVGDRAGIDAGVPPDGGRGRWLGRLAWSALLFGLLLGPALLSVFRYTTAHLQGDGVWQSVMSVQDVDLFYWGQDRFFAVVR